MIKKFELWLEKHNLKKKYPEYITIPIFRFMILAICLVAVLDLHANDWNLIEKTVICPDNEYGNPCRNPFYKGDYPLITDTTAYSCYQVNPTPETTPYVCPGDSLKRDDIYTKYGVVIMMSIILFAFLVNHFYYFFRTGRHKPQ